MSSRLRILVFGYMVRMPLGGLVWHYLQYVLGLAALGHDVYYLEDSCFFEDEETSWFYDPATGELGPESGPGMAVVDELLRGTVVEGKWAFFDASKACWHGPSGPKVPELCRSADLIINVSAANPIRDQFLDVPKRVFLDTDPAFSQVRILTNGHRRDLAERHTHFATFGELIGTDACTAPTADVDWIATRQPIVLDCWTPQRGPEHGSFTTVMAWDSFESEEHAGVRYEMKSRSFADVAELPTRVAEHFELGLFDPTAAPASLSAAGWKVCDGRRATADPSSYRDYVVRSKGEFSVAKHGYVSSRCGWFSDRSATYLASARPVILQDTGFSEVIPTGKGLLGYQSLDEACAAVEEVSRQYRMHCAEARALAEECFAADKVLGALLDHVG